jgi:hypothetical protein
VAPAGMRSPLARSGFAFALTPAATEDKILQRVVSMILEPIYGQEFLPFCKRSTDGHRPVLARGASIAYTGGYVVHR